MSVLNNLLTPVSSGILSTLLVIVCVSSLLNVYSGQWWCCLSLILILQRKRQKQEAFCDLEASVVYMTPDTERLSHSVAFNLTCLGITEMAQQLRFLAVLPAEDLGQYQKAHKSL